MGTAKWGRVIIAVLSLLLAGCLPYSSKLYEIGASFERSLAGLETRVVEVDGTTYAYLERKGDGDTIVLLHGFGTDKDSWVRFVRYLPSEYHVVVFDLPGHGQSSFDSRTVYDAPGIARLLLPALAALGIDHYHLAGHSLGGWIATLLAADLNQSVLTLALVDSAGLIPPVKSDFQHLLDTGVNPLLVETRADFDRLLAFIFHREPLIPWPGRRVLAEKFTSRAAINRKIWNDLSNNRVESSPQLKRLGMPTLILWGDRDRIIDKSVVARFTQYLSHATPALMKACGHSPITERPREAAAFYSRFLIDPASVADFHPSTLRLRAIESPNR